MTWMISAKEFYDQSKKKNQYILLLIFQAYGTNIVLTWQHITVMSHVHHGNSNHWQLHCMFHGLSQLKTKEIEKVHITASAWGESTGNRWFSLIKCREWGKCNHVMMSWYSKKDICLANVSAIFIQKTGHILELAWSGHMSRHGWNNI